MQINFDLETFPSLLACDLGAAQGMVGLNDLSDHEQDIIRHFVGLLGKSCSGSIDLNACLYVKANEYGYVSRVYSPTLLRLEGTETPVLRFGNALFPVSFVNGSYKVGELVGALSIDPKNTFTVTTASSTEVKMSPVTLSLYAPVGEDDVDVYNCAALLDAENYPGISTVQSRIVMNRSIASFLSVAAVGNNTATMALEHRGKGVFPVSHVEVTRLRGNDYDSAIVHCADGKSFWLKGAARRQVLNGVTVTDTTYLVIMDIKQGSRYISVDSRLIELSPEEAEALRQKTMPASTVQPEKKPLPPATVDIDYTEIPF
jgi:hypothetical protein